MNKPAPAARSAYPHFLPITTRWMDNDVAISYVVEWKENMFTSRVDELSIDGQKTRKTLSF
ncbi:hypothetical protein [Burkholderia sp. 9120]|uniref:hypothetical protein n=1 Tax=Burkholderia sp. 9120 TaxID=1500897 RepID=UPI0012E08ED4|nr:hypothetical protein [Burkholderia sp. 9120]